MTTTSYQVLVNICGLCCILGILSKSAAADDTCYCLKEEQGELKDPVVIEPVTINGRRVYLLAEQRGIIHVYDPQNSGPSRLVPYIDLSNRVITSDKSLDQRGLLGFATHPDFANNKKVFVYSTRNVLNKEYAVLSEVTSEDLEAERILLLIELYGPRRKGGQLLFGHDGYLYVFVGDGDPQNDVDIQSQDGTRLQGKVLQLDVDHWSIHDYRLQYFDIPTDYPHKAGWRREIYAAGVRNTWKCFIDQGDQNGFGRGRIFCGELGESISDEIILLEKGANYGWPLKEGLHCRAQNVTNCNNIEDEVLPIKSFDGSITAVIGGPVYRGAAFSALYGRVLYGDFATGNLYNLEQNNDDTWTDHVFNRCDDVFCACDARRNESAKLLSFGQTHDGELLLLMTTDPNPSKPSGKIVSLHAKSETVTCGSSTIFSSLHRYTMVLFISSLTLLVCSV